MRVTSALLNDTITLYDSRFNEKPLSASLQTRLALVYKSRTEEDDNGEKTLFLKFLLYNNSQVHQTVDVLPMLLLIMLVCL